MKAAIIFALVLAGLPGCRRPWRWRPADVSRRARFFSSRAPARRALARAEKLFEQLDYEGIVHTLAPYESCRGLRPDEALRLRHLLGAAYYLTGEREAAARVFRACPPALNAAEFPPSLRRFYQRHAGQGPGKGARP